MAHGNVTAEFELKKEEPELDEVEPRAPRGPNVIQSTWDAFEAAGLDVTKVSAQGSNRRTSRRVKIDAAIDFRSDHNFYSGFAANISDGGLFIATLEHLSVGDEVELSFSLPSGERIKADGIVRWIRVLDDNDPASLPGVGVQFTGLAPSELDAIHRFVAQRDPMFYVD